MSDYLLLTPGPTNVPERVLQKTALQMIHHRTKEYQAILERVNENLRKIFCTRHPVLTLACSGTGAMEASITNLLSSGDKVLSFSAGKWGERYRDIAKTYGLNVVSVEKAYGAAFEAAEVARTLKEHPDAKAVLMTLCETSTAVTHPIEAIAAVTRQSGAMLFVDAISGLLCDPLRMDDWGVDVVVCGSQKGMMLPPGLAFVALGERAQSALASSKMPRYYFNLADTLKALKKNDTPFTPAVGLVRGLEEALLMVLEEGVDKVCTRHAEVAAFVRKKIAEKGLRLFAERPSNGLTAIVMPEGVNSGDLIKHMRDRHKIVMADGQGELKGRIVRFAHMGYACTMSDAQKGLDAFWDAWNSVKAQARAAS